MSISENIRYQQEGIYKFLNTTARTSPNLARLAVVPVALIEIALEVIQAVAYLFEKIGWMFSGLNDESLGRFSIKTHLLRPMTCVIKAAVEIPTILILAPFKLVHQIGAGLMSPERIKSFDYSHYTYSDFYAEPIRVLADQPVNIP